MRRILIEHARSRAAVRHGGEWRRFPLTEQDGRREPKPEELVAVDEAGAHLERADPRLARVVELRYFAGFTVPETARALGISPRTVNRFLAAARAWLAAELNGRRDEPPAAP